MNKTYLCDPARNQACSKALCFERGGPCGTTNDVRCALRDLFGQPVEIIEDFSEELNEEKGPGWELIPQERRDQILHSFSTLAENITIVSREITVQLTPVLKSIANALAKIFLPTDDVLRAYASPKEWRIYKQTKKRRTKKKYRDRFIRRWAGKS